MFIDMSDDIRVFTIYITVHNFFHIKFFQTFVQTLCSNQTSLCLYLRDKNDDINFFCRAEAFKLTQNCGGAIDPCNNYGECLVSFDVLKLNSLNENFSVNLKSGKNKKRD